MFYPLVVGTMSSSSYPPYSFMYIVFRIHVGPKDFSQVMNFCLQVFAIWNTAGSVYKLWLIGSVCGNDWHGNIKPVCVGFRYSLWPNFPFGFLYTSASKREESPPPPKWILCWDLSRLYVWETRIVPLHHEAWKRKRRRHTYRNRLLHRRIL